MTAKPLYSTTESYLSALDAYGATVDDIPMLIARLRETHRQLNEARAEIARRDEEEADRAADAKAEER